MCPNDDKNVDGQGLRQYNILGHRPLASKKKPPQKSQGLERKWNIRFHDTPWGI